MQTDVKRIIGIDPGQTTGYVDALFDLNSGTWQVVDAREIAWDERFILKPLLAGALCTAYVQPLLPDFVVTEQFTLYAFKAKDQIGSTFPSVRVIGTLEAYMQEFGILRRLCFQPASVRSRVLTLEEHRRWLVGSVHKHDAYQHLRYFIVTHDLQKA